uniref:Uncharacterized protein n=1 Tax=Anguilla anguilla TaxID=7936 RepID=A0A0E9Q1E4_ANGAN
MINLKLSQIKKKKPLLSQILWSLLCECLYIYIYI